MFRFSICRRLSRPPGIRNRGGPPFTSPNLFQEIDICKIYQIRHATCRWLLAAPESGLREP